MDRPEREVMPVSRRTDRPVTIFLIVVNVIIFAVLEVAGDTTDAVFMVAHGAMFTPYCIEDGRWYLLFTSMFLHFGFPHLLNNMFMLFCLGDYLERFMGRIKYLVLYLVSGLAGNMLSMVVELKKGEFAVSAGASGAIFGIIGGLLWVVLRNKGRIANLSTRGILFMLALSLYFGFTSTGVDNWAHIGGTVGGFFMAILLYRKENRLYFKRKNHYT